MKKPVFYGLLIAAILLCVIIAAFFFLKDGENNSDKETEALIHDRILQGESTFKQIGVIPEDMLRENVEKIKDGVFLTEEQKERLIADLEEEFNASFSSEQAALYKSQLESKCDAFTEPQEATENQPTSSFAVRSGILDFKLNDLTVEENEATAETTFVGYTISVETTADNKYLLTMTMSKYDCVYLLEKDDYGWRITDVPQYQENFAPDSFEETRGTYETMDEALDAADQINPEEENPF